MQPLVQALLRRYIGPNVSVKERRKSWKFIHSLEDPPEFKGAETLSQFVLFFVVFFVYSSIAPITSLFLCACFLICESGYRYNFIHSHYMRADSGGKIWEGFIHVLMSSMIIGLITLMGVLALKGSVYAVPAIAPLLGILIYYMILVFPKRMHVSKNLPALQCVELDRQYNTQDAIDMEFFKRKYLQPALQNPRLFPEEPELP
jgi:hypothetical protein